MHGSRRNSRILCGLGIVAALGCGYLYGSVYPFHANQDCHLLGGYLEAIAGPGKPTNCVIPWDTH
ncbi:MAG: hypothetical protein U1B82_12690 [Cypionkella sp.]|nr:hypothetical protein [Cypionkella sp.]